MFDDAGHYVARQVQKDGIYGYRLYGNVSYFGVAEAQVDSTGFCNSANGNTTRFNSPGWTGAYGCTENILHTSFPLRSSAIKKTSADVDGGAAMQQVVLASGQSAAIASEGVENVGMDQQPSTAWMAWLLGGLPITAVGIAVVGWKSLRKKGRIE